MEIEFYNVKLKKKVQIDEANISKKKYDITTKSGKKMSRYGLVAEHEGTKLTKFVSETTFNELDVPTVN